MNHRARNGDEISFQTGDILEFNADNSLILQGLCISINSNEYMFGIHNKTKKSDLYPRFKVTDLVEF